MTATALSGLPLPRAGSPAALLPPVTPDMVEAVALHHGVCIRPVPGALTPTPICHVNRDAKKPQP